MTSQNKDRDMNYIVDDLIATLVSLADAKENLEVLLGTRMKQSSDIYNHIKSIDTALAVARGAKAAGDTQTVKRMVTFIDNTRKQLKDLEYIYGPVAGDLRRAADNYQKYFARAEEKIDELNRVQTKMQTAQHLRQATDAHDIAQRRINELE